MSISLRYQTKPKYLLETANIVSLKQRVIWELVQVSLNWIHGKILRQNFININWTKISMLIKDASPSKEENYFASQRTDCDHLKMSTFQSPLQLAGWRLGVVIFLCIGRFDILRHNSVIRDFLLRFLAGDNLRCDIFCGHVEDQPASLEANSCKESCK